MKKSSTWTVGLDLGDEFSQLYVLDGDAELVEEGRVRMEEGALCSRFRGLAPALVVMEVGTHSPWVSRLLEELGHECLVANPASLYRKGRNKSDRIDAEKLARWGRADRDLLEPVRHASAEVQADMAIVQSRRSLIEMRTKLVNRCRGLVKSFGGRLPSCDTAYFEVKARPHIPPELAPAVEPLLETIGGLNGRLKKLDGIIDALVNGKYAAATGTMQQIKGVGPVTALTFVLTVRDPERFVRSRQLGPYLGLTPRQDQSGNIDREHRISKAGNAYLRQLLVQAAHHVLWRGPDTDLKRWGMAKAAGGKRAKRRAVVAVARKLAVLMHALWRSGEVYQPRREEADVGLPAAGQA